MLVQCLGNSNFAVPQQEFSLNVACQFWRAYFLAEKKLTCKVDYVQRGANIDAQLSTLYLLMKK